MAQDINRDKTEVGAARWTAPASVLHFTGQNVMLRWARFSPQRHRQRRSRMDSARNFSYDIRKIWQHCLVFHNSLCYNIWRVSVGFMILTSTWTISAAKMRKAAFPIVLNASVTWSRKRSASAPNKASLPPKRKIVGSRYVLSIPATRIIWADLHKLKTELRKIMRSRRKCCETKVLSANRIYPSIGA